MTAGAIIMPSISPNFIQDLFKGTKIIGFIKAIIKKIVAIINAHKRIFADDNNGQKDIIKKTNPNKIPKLFSEDFFINLKFYKI